MAQKALVEKVKLLNKVKEEMEEKQVTDNQALVGVSKITLHD